MSTLAVAPRPLAGGATLLVDPTALAANTRLLARAATGELMAVVKADGFGHGALTVARAALAHGATRVGVTGVDEALPLREAGITAPMLSWLNPVDADYAAALDADVELAVPTRDHLQAVLRAAAEVGPAGWSRQARPPGRETRPPGREARPAGGARPSEARVHLHLDTGMARDGAEPTAWLDLCRAARRAERQGLLRVVGMMGHLACADDPADPANVLGRTRFAWGLEVARAAGLRPVQRHLAATSATLTDPLSHHTMSRVGAGLVGIDPTRTTPLLGAMTLTAPLVSVRSVRAGTSVGYGHTWAAPRTTRLGLLPLGYADGLPRAASGRAEVLVRGRRHPLVGRISMDMAVVDLADVPAEAGERATVFGPGDDGEPTVADWAGWAGTIEHEIVTGLGSRVSRTVRGAGLRSIS